MTRLIVDTKFNAHRENIEITLKNMKCLWQLHRMLIEIADFVRGMMWSEWCFQLKHVTHSQWNVFFSHLHTHPQNSRQSFDHAKRFKNRRRTFSLRYQFSNSLRVGYIWQNPAFLISLNWTVNRKKDMNNIDLIYYQTYHVYSFKYFHGPTLNPEKKPRF